ncbi:hypothetical protein E2320_002872 [Naja naja]|nr:hypothetical protein E2320_002872 [Naja naja]
MAALRTAALQCGFKELDDMLLDQLVYGVRDLRLQRRLLAKGDLTLKMAIEEAQAAEMSNLSAAEIQGATSSPAAKPNATVHFEEITPDEILDYGEDVNRLTNRQQLQQQRALPPTRYQKHRDECFTVTRASPTDSLNNLSQQLHINKLHVTILLEGKECPMEIDTGSSLSILSWSTLKRLIPSISKKRLQPCNLSLKVYQGQKITTGSA